MVETANKERKLAKRWQEVKFTRDLREGNRKPHGGSWYGADKVAQRAARQYTKALRAQVKKEMKKWF